NQLSFDGRGNQASDGDGLADRVEVTALGAQQDHEVLDDPVQVLRLVANIRCDRATPFLR
ncbi:MAG TPA: hypothetical protein VKC59_03245, partial [Candidatus Limnocylindrales bacterium]|nr:hypothetical protein [Candidatus Limnocylindrales bacterium]